MVFQARQDLPVGLRPRSVVIADLDADGIPDLAVANGQGASLTIYLGNDDGTYRQEAINTFGVGSWPNDIVAGDFNGDNRLDLATGDSGSDRVSVLLGNGDGSFGIAHPFPVSDNPLGVVSTDFNGDNFNDLGVANGGENSISKPLPTK